MITFTIPADLLAAQVTSPISVAGNNIPCYCSWFNIGFPTPGYKFTALPGGPPTGIPTAISAMVAGSAIEIREVTISNVFINQPPIWPPSPNAYPINVIIYALEGITGQYYQLFQCALQPGETLSYNATAE